MPPASRSSSTAARTDYRSHLWSSLRPQRKAAALMQGPEDSASTTHKHDHPLSNAQGDVKLELLDGNYIDVQHDMNSPSTVTTGHEGDETSKPTSNPHVRTDQPGQPHGKEEISDRKRLLRHPEGKLTKQSDNSKVKWLEAELFSRDEILQVKEVELDSMRDIAERQEQEIHKLSIANQRLKDDMKQMKAELHHANTKLQQTSQLLHERSEELITAQQFLGKADSISPTEVVKLVEMLNAEIAQLSNLIIDSLTFQKWTGPTNDLDRLFKDLHGHLGPWLENNLWRRLQEPKLEFDLFVTQLALQTGLISACTRVIACWDPPFRKEGSTLSRIYGGMRNTVGQVVAGRWRALSSTYMGVDRQANKDAMRKVVHKLIIAVGGALGKEDSLPPDLKGKVDDITRKALEIHKHVWNSLTSMDLRPYSVPCDTPFDASQMDDADEGQGQGKNRDRQGKVICTLEMGLWYKKGLSSGKQQSELREERGMILKPKVMLGYVLAD